MGDKENQDVLSLSDSGASECSASEFSGFSPESEIVDSPVRPKTRVKSLVFKKKKAVVGTSGVDKKVKKSDKKAEKQPKPKKSSSKSKTDIQSELSPVLDFSKLSQAEISNLRQVLGIKPTNEKTVPETGFYENYDDYDDQSQYCEPFDLQQRNFPNIHVTVENDDEEVDNSLQYDSNNNQKHNLGTDFVATLFKDSDANEKESEHQTWDLPKLKIPDKGCAIDGSLAKLINTSCSVCCETEEIVNKYKIPENCEYLGAPLVNNEIWRVLDKKARSQDRSLADIQNLVATSVIPLVKLANLTNMEKNEEAKKCVSDVMVLLGQVHYNLSLRRRYMIRPNLNKKYSNLCNMNMPITSQLFGDDLSKDIKTCDSNISLGKDARYFGRGRGNYQRFKPVRRGSSGGYDPQFRSHPYSPAMYRGQFRGRLSSQRGRRFPPATATVTSDQAKN